MNNSHHLGRKSILLLTSLFILSNALLAQVDTTKAKTDTTKAKADTVKAMAVDTTKKAVDTTKKAVDTATKTAANEKKVTDRFIVYAGPNVNSMDVISSKFEAESGVGYHVGFAYRRGGFTYWQLGARYNNAVYDFVSRTTNTDTSSFSIKSIDVPITAGINFLSFANRVVNLRVFVSAVPAFTIGVGDNNLAFTKDHVNSFVFYGQAGIGADIAFFVLEVGFNYGFGDMMKNYSGSKPSQAFLNLGFRF